MKTSMRISKSYDSERWLAIGRLMTNYNASDGSNHKVVARLDMAESTLRRLQDAAE